ncbi:MAG: mercury(II) reductase [Bacteroidetes bacterium]|nr:mercury(II) reductase [Bacteroidota bacterium]
MTIQTLKLEISGMTCDHCARTIEKKLNLLDGIKNNKISFTEKEGVIEFDSSKAEKEDIINAINSTGNYKVKGEKSIESSLESKFDLIIIGGGSAAFSAAIKASELEKKVLMINYGLPIGGTCVNVGCVPSKTLIRTAEQFYNANHPNFTGIKPGNNKIDFKEVINQKRELVENLRQKKYINIISDDPNVTFLKGRGIIIDGNTVEVDSQKYFAENILIATGSSTFIPNIPGLNQTKFYTNDSLYELEELPEHLIVIGGRYIALENAQMFERLGSKVTILQRSSRILPSEMPDLTETLADYLREEGMEIKTGVEIGSVSEENGRIKIKAKVKDVEELIEGTHLFIATGRKGNTNNLGLEELGIETRKNSFIKTNEFLQTNINNIYSAGDVTGEYLFVYSAAYEGSLAVQNMFGENQTKKDYSIFPWVIFTDPQVAGVGMDENQAYENNINYEASTIQLTDIPRSLAARNTRGFIKLIRDKETDKLIGARILASEGSELLMEISLAIKYGITVKELKQMFHPYLTLSEGIKITAIGFDKDVHKLSCCAV